MKKFILKESELTKIIQKVITEKYSDYEKRQDALTPGKNPDAFYGDGSLDKLRNMNQDEKKHRGSYMAKQQLYNIAKKAQSVHDRLDDDEQLEDWMESKIAQMADSIDSVSNSFDYKSN